MRTSTKILALASILVTIAAETESLLTGGTCSFPTWVGVFDCIDPINPQKLHGLSLTDQNTQV